MPMLPIFLIICSIGFLTRHRARCCFYSGVDSVNVNFGTGIAIDGFGDTDTFSGIERVAGTSQDDVFIGTCGAQKFIGRAGNDNIDGQGSFADGVRYDRDAISVGTAGVTVDLGVGTAIDGFGDTDTLANIERVRGTSEDDILTGSGSDNRFRGLDGNDTIAGGAGTADEIDYLQDEASGGLSGVSVNLKTGTATDGFGGTDTISNVENIRGTGNFDDTLIGDANANKFVGLGGNGTIDGGEGIDTIDYSQDSIFGGTAGVTVDRDTGTATDGFGSTDSLANIESD